MDSASWYHLAADLVLIVHLALVGFVVLGLLLILAGAVAGWSWVRNFTFRVVHLAAIAVIALQAWLGRLCPLTVLESALRSRAGGEPYAGSFRFWRKRASWRVARPAGSTSTGPDKPGSAPESGRYSTSSIPSLMVP